MRKDEFSTRVKTGMTRARIQGKSIGGFVDLSGQRFGKLLVLEQAANKRSSVCWLCRCDCGKTKDILASNLGWKKGSKLRTASCGCSMTRVKPFMYILYTYRASAKSKKLAFELTNEQFERLTSSNCDYCGSAPSQGMYPSHKRKALAHESFRWNGIDRINSSKGYIEGNVVPCCKPCNELKSDKSREEFMRLIEAIYKHRIARSVSA